MFWPTIVASSKADFIFWTILAIFWAISQLMSRFGKSGKRPTSRPPPTPDHDTPPSVEDDLREFLDSLSGRRATTPEPELVFEDPPTPVEPRAVPPPVPAPQRKVSRSYEPEQTEESEPPIHQKREIRTRIARPERRSKANIGDLRGEISDHREGEPPAHSLINPDSLLVGLHGLKMPIMSIPLTTPHHTFSTAWRPSFEKPGDVKRAMISKIILDAPVGLPGSRDGFKDTWRH